MNGLSADNHSDAPLAERLRPRTLDQVIGQRHLLAPGKPLALAFQSGQLHSMILWGPPGVGKTTLARLMADAFAADFIALSAVFAGVRDIREAVARAEVTRARSGRRTILFVDEVHRFNKAQQDAFLPYVEGGLLTFVGATTENPSFEVNSALLSRAAVYVLQSLSEENWERCSNVPAGSALSGLPFDDDARERLIGFADGDARKLLNLLEQLGTADARTAESGSLRRRQLSSTARCRATCAASTRAATPSMTRFQHCTSRCAVPIPMPRCTGSCACSTAAPIRSIWAAASCAWRWRTSVWPIRGRWRFRLQACQTYERLGSPEGELALAQAVIFLACAAKSNAVYKAYNAVRRFVGEDGSRPVPLHLRNAPTKLMKNMGFGAEYRYAHDEEGGYAAGESYLPAGMPTVEWYRPVARGLEIRIGEKLAHLRELDRRAKQEKD
jgi:putative ATPase